MKTKGIVYLTIIMTLILSLFASPSKAASFSASAGNQNLNIGDTSSVTIGIDDCYGKFRLESSNSSVILLRASGDKDWGQTTAEWVEGSSKSVSVKAVGAGTATIKVTAENVTDTAGDNIITGSKSITINVKDPTPPPSEPSNQEQPTNQGGNNGNAGTSNRSRSTKVNINKCWR